MLCTVHRRSASVEKSSSKGGLFFFSILCRSEGGAATVTKFEIGDHNENEADMIVGNTRKLRMDQIKRPVTNLLYHFDASQ